MLLPWWFPFGRVDEIAPRDLQNKLRNDGVNLQLIDVRSTAEYAGGHIARTRNVPIDTLQRELANLKLDPSRPVIAICLSGHRSVPAYRLLKRAGFNDVRQLSGGMLAWWRDQLPTVKDAPR